MTERISIRDVARHAGVSISTVSRVLAEHPYVRDETRQQVLQAVKQLDYQPDQIARSLRRRQTNLLGLVVSTIENIFFTEVARAAEKEAHQRGYNLIVCNTEERPELEEDYLKVLNQQLVAGVILAPVPGEGHHLDKFLEEGLAMILINRRMDHLACSSITSDDEQAAFDCVSWLIRQGRRRIAAITGLSHTFTTEERLHGYRRALLAAEIAPDPAIEVGGQAHLEGGYQAAVALMQQADPPDALFVFNNLMTQGAVLALHDLGIHWPDKVDVAGFGAFKTARLFRPPLSLIKQPTAEMGRQAVTMLIEQITNAADEQPQTIVLQNELISREVWLQQPAILRYDSVVV